MWIFVCLLSLFSRRVRTNCYNGCAYVCNPIYCCVHTTTRITLCVALLSGGVAIVTAALFRDDPSFPLRQKELALAD